MGVISIGGLVASTVLTLLVVPVVYTLIDDAGTLLLRAVRRRPVNAGEAHLS
jgi:HAE1 family hydrophobic/amphiphilic exporter-1